MHSQGKAAPEITLQVDVEIPTTVTEENIGSLVHLVLEAEGVGDAWHLGVRFVDDETMQAAHVEFMDIDTPTDIMTFPFDDGDDDSFGFGDAEDDDGQVAGGDLLISVDRAAENSEIAGWSTEEELFFLIVHGVLHLLGWDDATDADRQAMLDRQAHLLSEWRESPEARR